MVNEPSAGDRIADLIGRVYRDEDQLQAGIAALLRQAGYEPRREVRLSGRDRVDLLVDEIGIEVKVAGAVDRLATQLGRYAASERIHELLVVTTRARHRGLPEEISGKRCTELIRNPDRPLFTQTPDTSDRIKRLARAVLGGEIDKEATA